MKKLFALVLMLTLFKSVKAQSNFVVGVNYGLPFESNIDEYLKFNASFNIGYLYNLTDEFQVGVIAGYSNTFGKEVVFDLSSYGLLGQGEVVYKIPNVEFLPIAGAFRYEVVKNLRVGCDVGYAINLIQLTDLEVFVLELITDINFKTNGTFYSTYRIQYNFISKLDTVLSYQSLLVDHEIYGLLALGLEYKFL